MQLSTIMLLSTIITTGILLFLYPKIRAIGLITNKARLLVILGIVWLVLWFVMCYFVAIGMYLVGAVI